MAVPSANGPRRVLYSYWQSSCSWRVRIGLHWKGLPYEYRPVNLAKGEDSEPHYWKLNPAGVPTLVDEADNEGTKIVATQSLAILEYLEERYPEAPSLLPPRNVTGARVAVRGLAHFIASGIQPLQNLGTVAKVGRDFGDERRKQWTHDVIHDGAAALEAQLAQHAGMCSFGDSFTMADAVLVPQAYAARIRGVDLSVFPTIARVLKHVEPHESVVATHPDRMPDAVVVRR